MYVVGWPCALGLFLFLPASWTLSAIGGPDAVEHAEWFFWGSIGVMPIGAALLWLAARDDEDRSIRNDWAHSLWRASHRRPGGGYDGSTSSASSSSGYDPTYGAAWSGGYDGGSYDGGGGHDGGGYSGGSDGGGGGGYSSSY
jgi:hypothetical protein